MNKLNLIIERGKVWNISDLPTKSIALDGSVQGPFIDNKNKIYSFDHHDNCIRHVSSASCVQVLDALLLDFDANGYNVFINDVDGDTLIAFALLQKPELSKNSYVRKITRTIGLIDAHGPSYSIDEEEQKILKIFQNNVTKKIYELKSQKKYSECDLKDLLLDCVENFYLMAEGKFELLEEEVKELIYELSPKTNSDWIMVKTDSYNIMQKLYSDGYNKFIVWNQQPNGSFAYSLAKKSEFVDFPVKNILNELNIIESGWGGGTTIGGSPRNSDGSRSKIEPDEIVKIVNNILSKKI